MKLTQRMQDAINAQINFEMYSANIYLSMACHFAQKGLEGFAHWMRKQYAEEIGHAEDMMQYLISRGGQVKIGAVAAVPTEFGEALEIGEQVYEHECLVSEKIQEIVRLASEEHDMPSQDFFWKYIREQVEEEATAAHLVELLSMAHGHAILYLDEKLSKR